MAKTAKKTAKKSAKAEKVEPFFRPFEKLPKTKPNRDRQGAEPRDAPKPDTAKRHTTAQKRAQPKSDDASRPQPVDPETFAIYMAGVRALPEDRAHRIPRTASKIEKAAQGTAASDPDASARARMRSLVTEGLRFETIDDGERLEGRRLDVDPRELRRLRRAQYAIDGKLDLHGLGIEEARHAVEAFIKKRAHDGDKVVLIVHGKGSHSPRGQAVLRGEIAAWLSQGRSARHIAAFATAPDEHGGTGAVLVLLAR
jgi:DNA-nicking Smr family endonuclease